MRCGENPVHERMNSVAENKGAVKTIRQGRSPAGCHELKSIELFCPWFGAERYNERYSEKQYMDDQIWK